MKLKKIRPVRLFEPASYPERLISSVNSGKSEVSPISVAALRLLSKRVAKIRYVFVLELIGLPYSDNDSIYA
ncbi:MAG: hypothetical protein K8F91_07695, partial [Candidatus Obscuribacterales bacterium]|nr:hypothetical protein [Candidatus Obscuribacterales bacterium]